MAKGSMREAMPRTTEFIDYLREQFGADYINNIIRAGMAGKPVFFASENGQTVGTPVPRGRCEFDPPDWDTTPMNDRERRWEKQLKGAK